MGVSEMRFEVYEAAAFDLLRDQVELLQARVKDDEERMLDRHMTGMGAISSTGVVTDETRALWKAVGDYREQAGA